MARLKQGLDYFPLDVHFFQNKKIKSLKSRYGVDGISIYLYFLCEIYKNGYYIIVDDDFIDNMVDDLKMNSNKIKQVLSFLLERSLLDRKLFQSDKILTSASVQRNFQFAVKERAKNNPIEIVGRFWLLQEKETETFIQVRNFLKDSGENAGNCQENAIKESKEKKIKEENSIFKRANSITREEKQDLVHEFGEEVTEEYIRRTTQYHCCNYATIKKWIAEDQEKHKRKETSTNKFNDFPQRDYGSDGMSALERQLLEKSVGKGL